MFTLVTLAPMVALQAMTTNPKFNKMLPSLATDTHTCILSLSFSLFPTHANLLRNVIKKFFKSIKEREREREKEKKNKRNIALLKALPEDMKCSYIFTLSHIYPYEETHKYIYTGGQTYTFLSPHA